MIPGYCIDREKDKRGVYFRYTIRLKNGSILHLYKNDLIEAIRSKEFKIINLKLTSDNTLRLTKPISNNPFYTANNTDENRYKFTRAHIEMIDYKSCKDLVFVKEDREHIKRVVFKSTLMGFKVTDLYFKRSMVAIDNGKIIVILADGDIVWSVSKRNENDKYLFEDTYFGDIILETDIEIDSMYILKKMNVFSLDIGRIKYETIRLNEINNRDILIDMKGLENINLSNVLTFEKFIAFSGIKNIDMRKWNLSRSSDFKQFAFALHTDNLIVGEHKECRVKDVREAFKFFDMHDGVLDLRGINTDYLAYTKEIFCGAKIKGLILDGLNFSRVREEYSGREFAGFSGEYISMVGCKLTDNTSAPFLFYKCSNDVKVITDNERIATLAELEGLVVEFKDSSVK